MKNSSKKFFKHVEAVTIPKMRECVVSLTIFSGKVDVKLCVELGAAILLDKPILVVVERDTRIPVNLKRCASRIIEIDFDRMDPRSQEKIRAALDEILKNDERAKERKTVM